MNFAALHLLQATLSAFLFYVAKCELEESAHQPVRRCIISSALGTVSAVGKGNVLELVNGLLGMLLGFKDDFGSQQTGMPTDDARVNDGAE